MRRVLFATMIAVLLFGASSALANTGLAGYWLARDQNQEVFLALFPNGTYQYRHANQQQSYTEQGRFQMQGQNMYVQPNNATQGYYVQLRLNGPNALEIYRNGQYFATLARIDAQGNLVTNQGGMQQGGMQQGGGQGGMQGGMQQGGGQGGMQGGMQQGGGQGGMQGGMQQGGGQYGMQGGMQQGGGQQGMQGGMQQGGMQQGGGQYGMQGGMQQGGGQYGMQGGMQGGVQQGGQQGGMQQGGQQQGNDGPAGRSQMSEQAFKLNKQAWGLFEQKRYEEAIAAVGQTLGVDPRNADAYEIRAMSYREKGDYARAAADYSKVLEINPNNSLIYYQRAAMYTRIMKWDQALADAEEYIRRKPDDPDGPKLKATILKIKQRHTSGAGQTGGQGVTGGGHPQAGAGGGQPAQDDAAAQVKELYRRGFALQKEKKYDQAIEAYNQAIALDPRCEAAYHLRGLAWWEKGQYFKAVDDYDKALELNPNNALAYFHRAVSRMELEKWDQALADIDEYIRRKPDDPDGPKLRSEITRKRAARQLQDEVIFKNSQTGR